jgi:hypothetical protein
VQAVAALAVLAGAAVVGLFDAALLLAWPTLLVWAALGALGTTDALREMEVGTRARQAALVALALFSGLAAARSAGQVASMALYAADRSRDSLELAAALDPGSYRVHLRLARRYGRGSERRCEHALAARELLPNADAAARLARRCDGAFLPPHDRGSVLATLPAFGDAKQADQP